MKDSLISTLSGAIAGNTILATGWISEDVLNAGILFVTALTTSLIQTIISKYFKR